MWGSFSLYKLWEIACCARHLINCCASDIIGCINWEVIPLIGRIYYAIIFNPIKYSTFNLLCYIGSYYNIKMLYTFKCLRYVVRDILKIHSNSILLSSINKSMARSLTLCSPNFLFNLIIYWRNSAFLWLLRYYLL